MVSPTIQKIIIIIFTLSLLSFFGYRIFLTKSEEPVEPIEGMVVVGQDIIEMVEKTKNLEIDKSLFSSNLFLSLSNFDFSLEPEAQGRDNPFAPIGTDTVVVNPASAPLR